MLGRQPWLLCFSPSAQQPPCCALPPHSPPQTRPVGEGGGPAVGGGALLPVPHSKAIRAPAVASALSLWQRSRRPFRGQSTECGQSFLCSNHRIPAAGRGTHGAGLTQPDSASSLLLGGMWVPVSSHSSSTPNTSGKGETSESRRLTPSPSQPTSVSAQVADGRQPLDPELGDLEEVSPSPPWGRPGLRS